MKVLVAQSCLSFCEPMDHSPPGPSVHGILQARILEWVSFPLSRESSQSKDPTWVSSTEGRFFTTEPPGNHLQAGGGNSLAVQWLGLHASTAWGMGSVLGWGTKILYAVRCSQIKKKKLKKKNRWIQGVGSSPVWAK